LVYFGRMLDKVRLHAAGQLPPEYVANLGEIRPIVFDARCSRFLGVPYAEISARTLADGDDAAVLAWCHARGTPRSDDDCAIWNGHMTRLGWRDGLTERLQSRIAEYGLAGRGIETFFDLIEVDEGRPTGTRIP
jgi:gluconokinase